MTKAFEPLSKNQYPIDAERTCKQCGHTGDGFIREKYPDAGLAPLTICPECRCGF